MCMIPALVPVRSFNNNHRDSTNAEGGSDQRHILYLRRPAFAPPSFFWQLRRLWEPRKILKGISACDRKYKKGRRRRPSSLLPDKRFEEVEKDIFLNTPSLSLSASLPAPCMAFRKESDTIIKGGKGEKKQQRALFAPGE